MAAYVALHHSLNFRFAIDTTLLNDMDAADSSVGYAC